PGDDEEIRALWGAMASAWAAGDAAGFARCFAEDCDFVTTRGDRPRGRTEIAAGHARLFAGLYAGTRLEPELRTIRPLGHHRAAVDAGSIIRAAGGEALAATDAGAVVERRAGGWEIVRFHNRLRE